MRGCLRKTTSEEPGPVAGGGEKEDPEVRATLLGPVTGPAPLAPRMCSRRSTSAFGAKHLSQGAEVVVRTVWEEAGDAASRAEEVVDISLGASRPHDLLEKFLLCSRPSNKKARRWM